MPLSLRMSIFRLAVFHPNISARSRYLMTSQSDATGSVSLPARVGWTEWTYHRTGVTDFPATPGIVADPFLPPAGADVNTGVLAAPGPASRSRYPAFDYPAGYAAAVTGGRVVSEPGVSRS